MPWKAVAGSTFCLRPTYDGIEHLHFVLSNPTDFDGFAKQSCLYVNASTPKGRHDTTCIIRSGAHPFIQHDTFIYYRYAGVERAVDLEARLNPPNGLYRPHDDANIGLVSFILDRMAHSPHASRDLKKCAEIALKSLANP